VSRRAPPLAALEAARWVGGGSQHAGRPIRGARRGGRLQGLGMPAAVHRRWGAHALLLQAAPQRSLPPLLFSCRNVTLAPVTLGLDLPPWYQLLLDPYIRQALQRRQRGIRAA
jgi:hypothetical protein